MTLKKLFNKPNSKWMATLLVSLCVFTGNAFAQDKAGKEVSIKGEVLDLSCYMKNGAKGPDHKGCATGCLSKGNPIGILSTDGKVYLVVEDHKNAKPYEDLKGLAAEQVTVTGTLQERNGLPGIVLAKTETAK
jgi:hypothetical protein